MKCGIKVFRNDRNLFPVFHFSHLLVMKKSAMASRNSLPIPKYYYFLRAFGMAQIPFLSGYNKQRILHLFADKNCALPRMWKRYYYEVLNNGVKYSGVLGNYVDWFAFFFGGDEKRLLDRVYIPILESFDQPVFIDVGGNIGHHSLYLSPKVSLIHSFEPVPSCTEEFKRKMAVAGITNCALHEYGLGERDESMTIYCSTSFNGGTNSFLREHNYANTKSTIVNVKKFDELDCLTLPHITLVKIDVEGFESSVFLGMQRSLHVYRPFVIFELSDSSKMLLNEKRVSFLSLLPHGYLLVDADKLSCETRKWDLDLLNDYSITESFRGNVLCVPQEKLSILSQESKV